MENKYIMESKYLNRKMEYFIVGIVFVTLILMLYLFNPDKLYLAKGLVLALVPYIISTFIYSSKLSGRYINKVIIFLLIILWLFVYPNCVYMYTDYIYINKADFYTFSKEIYAFKQIYKFEILPWIFLGTNVAAVTFSCVLGYSSYVRMSRFLLNNIYDVETGFFIFIKKAIMLSVVSIVTGYEIYLGRVLKFNSWTFFTNPKDISAFVLNDQWERVLTLVGIFGMTHVVLMLIFHIVKRVSRG